MHGYSNCDAPVKDGRIVHIGHSRQEECSRRTSAGPELPDPDLPRGSSAARTTGDEEAGGEEGASRSSRWGGGDLRADLWLSLHEPAPEPVHGLAIDFVARANDVVEILPRVRARGYLAEVTKVIQAHQGS